MKFQKKPAVIEAEQWWPGKIVEGVCGGDRDKLCGCTLIGGLGDKPHVHTAHQGQIVLLEPGDWIVKEPNGDGYYPIKDEIMKKLYDEVT